MIWCSFVCLRITNCLSVPPVSNLRNFLSTWVLFFLHLLFIATDFSELQIYQSGFPSNMCESITKKRYSLWFQSQGNDLDTYRCTLFSVTYGVDWIDFVKDSITFKETYNLTSYCILLSFYCRIFHHTHCFPTVTKLFIFLVCYIRRPIYCL